MRLAGRGPPHALAGVEPAAMAVVAALAAALLRPERGQPLLGAEAAVGVAALEQDAGVIAVVLRALALALFLGSPEFQRQ